MTENEIKPGAGLELAKQITNNYVAVLEDSRTFGPCLALTPSGYARIAAICGWLCGLAEAGKEEVATVIADAFFKNMYQLGHWSDEEPDPVHFRVPKTRVLLSDDGSRHGFNVLWYQRVTQDMATAYLAKHRLRWFRSTGTEPGVSGADAGPLGPWGTIPYILNFNGGLLWHGPHDNSLAVTLDRSSFWSIHT